MKRYRVLSAAGVDEVFQSHDKAFTYCERLNESIKGVYAVRSNGALVGLNVWGNPFHGQCIEHLWMHKYSFSAE